jgi:hypothetical protein
MDFVNETKVEAGWTVGFEPDGRELFVVAIKATYSIPVNGGQPTLADEQVPLTEADEFAGEPGHSAVLYETDYAHKKPCCDVLLNGSAHAPKGKPARGVRVGMRVGPMTKVFNVIGDRVWEKNGLIVSPSPPSPFLQMPISYDRAYGGVDTHRKNPDKLETYTKNPVGVGYYPLTRNSELVGKPLPNTEETGKAVKAATSNYNPMSFGPIGRNFSCRIPHAGTYDQNWLKNRVPFWPDDFNYLYFQAAPPEQQVPHLKGGEEVTLHNLSPEGVLKFQIPIKPMPMLFIPYRGRDIERDGVIDTLLIEPDQRRFTLTWRVSLPLRRNCFELKQVIAGKMPRAWRLARRLGNKPLYQGLGKLVEANKARQRRRRS